MPRNPTVTDPIGRLVRKLGGPSYVARAIGATPGSVNQWRISGMVPWKHRPAVRLMAHGHEIMLTKAEEKLLKDNGTR